MVSCRNIAITLIEPGRAILNECKSPDCNRYFRFCPLIRTCAHSKKGLKELKGSKKVLLLPGPHQITVRHDGYKDFTQQINLQPAEKQSVQVTLEKDVRFQMPAVTAEIKVSVDPDRAAVFVDGFLAGHAGELGGIGKSLLVAPGKRKITISLPGYQTFETEVELAPHQKFTLKTKLLKTAAAPESSPPQ